MMKNSGYYLVAILFIPIIAFSQSYVQDVPQHTNEYGANVTMAMSGFGIGGFYRIAIPHYSFIGANIDFYMMRDDKEFTYYDPYSYYPYPIQINNVNRLFLIPVNIEFKHRLFYNDIEDNFRPHLLASGGIIFGMNFPKKDAITTDPSIQISPKNEYRMAFNFAVGLGIDVTTSNNLFFSIRPQYRFIQFPKSIAGKKGHSTFEIRLELGKR